MLKVLEYGVDQYEFPALVVLGCFDAIHQGHRELIKKAKLQAKINGLDLGVMMFRDGKNGKLVYSLEERIEILEQYNVKFIVLIDFNDDFKKIAPIDFLQSLEEKINVKAYMSGKDFRFGAQAKGKSSTLKNYAEDEENGVWYMPIKDVTSDGEKISTTLIKKYLEEGNVAKANELLGSTFSVKGEVVKGAGRGNSVLGFPTINVAYPDWKYSIKHGVYKIKCDLDGTVYDGVANFGECPTFDDNRVVIEAHLEGYEGDLYGKIVNIEFVEYIRDIVKFDSPEELTKQIKSDEQTLTEPVNEITEEVVESEPVEEPTAEEQPAEEVTEEPVAEEAVESEQVEEPTVEEQPAEEVTDEPVVEETVESESVEEPTAEEQPTEEVTEEPVAEEAVESEPVEEQPAEEVTEEPVVEETVENEPVEEAVVEEQPAEEVREEAVENEPVEEPVVEEQPAEEVTEEPVVEEAVESEPVEEPTAEEQHTEEVTEEPIAEETVESEPVEEPTVEEQPAEEVTEEPVEEEAVEEEKPSTEE